MKPTKLFLYICIPTKLYLLNSQSFNTEKFPLLKKPPLFFSSQSNSLTHPFYRFYHESGNGRDSEDLTKIRFDPPFTSWSRDPRYFRPRRDSLLCSWNAKQKRKILVTRHYYSWIVLNVCVSFTDWRDKTIERFNTEIWLLLGDCIVVRRQVVFLSLRFCFPVLWE